MKKLIAGVALVVAMGVTSASADDGQVSKDALRSYGLSSMQVVSDDEGMNIRGSASYARVYGVSSSDFIGNNDATHGYASGSTHFFGSSTAYGGSAAVSGGAISIGPFVGFVIVGSAGGAFAFGG